MNQVQRAPVSVRSAIAWGLVVVNAPVLALLLGGLWLGARSPSDMRGAMIGFGIGFVLAWLWWSLAVPRWRLWALNRGADPEKLQHWAQIAGLVWPRGWIFEKTELPPRRKDT